MSNKEKIAKQILFFINEELIEGLDISTEDSFEELGIDSQSIIQIVLFIERSYNIKWQEENLNKTNLRSIDSLAQFVANKNV